MHFANILMLKTGYFRRYWYAEALLAHILSDNLKPLRRTFLGNEIVDHSDVVGASPVGATPTPSSFST